MFYHSHQCQINKMCHVFSILDSILKFSEKSLLYQPFHFLRIDTDPDPAKIMRIRPDPDPQHSSRLW
jgi:hypothetical protein